MPSIKATLNRARELQQKCRSNSAMMSFRPGTRIRFTTVAAQSCILFSGRGWKDMVIATVLFIGFVIAAGAAIVTAYERYQDVLYGPYLKPME
jgi:hypothetical protein